MRDLWLICESCCCEEPCLMYIEGGGQSCERQLKPCLTAAPEDIRLEWWRPLTQKDIEEYDLSIWGMDRYLEGIIKRRE